MKKLILLVALVLSTCQIAAALDNLDTVYLKRTNGNIRKLKFSPNDQYILAVNDPHGAAVFTSANGEYAATFERVVAAQWSKDGRWFAAWVADGSSNLIVRFETETWRAIDTTWLPVGEPVNNDYDMALAPDNRTAAVNWIIPSKKSFQFYDLDEHKMLKETVYFDPGMILPFPPTVEALEMAYTPDSRYIIFHASDWQIRFFDVAKDSVVFVYQYGSGGGELTMSADGSKIAFSTHKKDIAVQVMDVVTMQIIGELSGNPVNVSGLSFSQDGQLIAVSMWELGRLKVYKIPSLEIVREWPSGSVYNVDYSHAGKYIISNIANYLLLFNAPTLVSVSENREISEVELFPIPVSENITLGLSLELPSNVELNVAALNGAVALQQFLQGANMGYNEWIVNVASLPSGTYTATLKAGKQHQVIRFIKL